MATTEIVAPPVPPVPTNAIITLEDLQCIRQTVLYTTIPQTNQKIPVPVDPYIWPALVSIDRNTLDIEIVSPPVDQARIILKSNIKQGDTANIPASIGLLSHFMEDGPGPNVLILAIALWEQLESSDTPYDAVQAGYQAYSSSLKTAIVANLLDLNSSDPAVQSAAIAAVKKAVNDGVTNAIKGGLTWYQKLEVWLGDLAIDGVIDDSSTVFEGSGLVSKSFTVSFGGSLGGRLLFYRDTTQNGTGDVDSPSVIGQGGWEGFKFLFSGGNGIIYAVNPEGQLLFYRDTAQNGTGDVNSPKVIGQGGWADFKFLFSGGNGIIYAVNQQGQLLFYRDYNQDGTGDVDTPKVIGLGGWSDFKFLFSGGNGIIYAVNQQGQLLFYRDYNQDGTGDVDTPKTIGLGGWTDFKFLFSGGNGIIYAVDQQGELLFYRDYNQDGTGDVDTPKTIGLGGWTDFNFLFSSGNGIIYAAEKADNPANYYEIDATLKLVPQRVFEPNRATT